MAKQQTHTRATNGMVQKKAAHLNIAQAAKRQSEIAKELTILSQPSILHTSNAGETKEFLKRGSDSNMFVARYSHTNSGKRSVTEKKSARAKKEKRTSSAHESHTIQFVNQSHRWRRREKKVSHKTSSALIRLLIVEMSTIVFYEQIQRQLAAVVHLIHRRVSIAF